MVQPEIARDKLSQEIRIISAGDAAELRNVLQSGIRALNHAGEFFTGRYVITAEIYSGMNGNTGEAEL